jgi:cellobiose phosphorylase
MSDAPLSNSASVVSDPVMSIRQPLYLKAGEGVTLDVIAGIGPRRAEALTLIDQYHDRRMTDRIFEMAWTQSQVVLRQFHATEEDAQLYAQLAGALVYAAPRHRAAANLLARNRKGQKDLWPYGIFGDLPIVLVRVADPASMDFVRKLIQGHAYWRARGLAADLFIWADAYAGYRQALLDKIVGVVNAGQEGKTLGQPGGIFVKTSDQLPEDDRLLLQAAARIVLSDRSGTLAGQVNRRLRLPPGMPLLRPVRRREFFLPGEREMPSRDRTFTGDRGEFIGRNRSAANPAAMQAARLSGRVGGGLDPCGAMQAVVTLAPGQREEIVFVLGAASNESEAHALLTRYASSQDTRPAFARTAVNTRKRRSGSRWRWLNCERARKPGACSK